jgi:hypothetical protein
MSRHIGANIMIVAEFSAFTVAVAIAHAVLSLAMISNLLTLIHLVPIKPAFMLPYQTQLAAKPKQSTIDKWIGQNQHLEGTGIEEAHPVVFPFDFFSILASCYLVALCYIVTSN